MLLFYISSLDFIIDYKLDFSLYWGRHYIYYTTCLVDSLNL